MVLRSNKGQNGGDTKGKKKQRHCNNETGAQLDGGTQRIRKREEVKRWSRKNRRKKEKGEARRCAGNIK